MKKMMLSALMLLTANVSATDAYKYKNLGFSADGRYYAFIESVIQDGSGYPSATGQVIDVAQNRTVKFRTVVLDNESSKESDAFERVRQELQLNRFGIDGRNPGRSLWVRLDTDLSEPVKNIMFSSNYYVDGGASAVWPKIKLDITEQEAPRSGEPCYGNESKMITLSMTDVESNTSRDLQVDSRVPASRACSWAYQMRQVIEFKGSIAAVVRYNTFGFEGPDYRHMVVTSANAVTERN